MDINNHNYEEFGIDYLEGNLSADMEEAMQFFLMQNPEIEAELMGLEEVVLQPDMEVFFSDKASLLQLEDSKRIVPLYLQWKRYVLPIAAAFCLFFVWQMVLESPIEGMKNGGIVAVEESGNDYTGEVIEGGNNVALEGASNDRNEEGKSGIDSEAEYNLKSKAENDESLAADRSAKPKVKAAKEVQASSKNELEVLAVEEIDETVNEGLEGESGVGELASIQEITPIEKVGFEVRENRNQSLEAKKMEQRGEGIAVNGRSLKSKKETTKRPQVVLTALPQKSNEIIEETIAMVEGDFRGLPEMSVENVEVKKQKSTFLNNLKRAITPEVFASGEPYEANNGSDILVSISVKPEQHNFIKKIFKNNR